MRPRIKRTVTPSSVKVFTTKPASKEELDAIKIRVKTLKRLDAIKASKETPKFAYVRIFGKEMRLPIEEIQKCNFKYYLK